MFKNYFTLAYRNLVKNKSYSLINIAGLSVGMGVAMIIGLWIWDEWSFDKQEKNHERIAKVMMTQTINGVTDTKDWMPIPMEAALKTDYGRYFTHTALWHGAGNNIIVSYNKDKFTQSGYYVEPEFPDMFALKMLQGSRAGLNDPGSVLLSASASHLFFGEKDPVNQVLKLNNKLSVKVAGVYADFPENSTFKDMNMLLPWKQFVNDQGWVERNQDNWGLASFGIFVQLAPGNTFDEVSAKIAGIKSAHAKDEIKFNPKVFLQAMGDWHLYGDFKNGVNVGGRIMYLKLFGIIGGFVLLLACINFMNLSTARSEKRAKEVGIRKAIGSRRGQLIWQFFSESLLVTSCAFVIALLLTQAALPFINEVAAKKMSIPWNNSWFWVLGVGSTFFTGLIAGSYPAFYLSSFRPVKVLKGTFRVGRLATLPRKALVVLQFSVSVVLIIGTVIVMNQVNFAKSRPVGYSRNGLLNITMNTPDIAKHFDAIRSDLLQTGAVASVSESSSPTTALFSSDSRLEWKGKDPSQFADFGIVACTHDYGKTIGWQVKAGRDFSRDFPSDSMALVVNESAVAFMGLKDPVGETIKWGGANHTIIGVTKDIVMNSPFEPIQPTIFFLNYEWANYLTIKLKPQASASNALAAIGTVMKKYNPEAPFAYRFLDEDYAQKFDEEVRIGKLAGFFTVLAIFISCLGLFGMASFMAEQRTREIGVRKVLGASVFMLWNLLSKEFVALVLLSFLIATPCAYLVMHRWLQNYTYHTAISWQTFAAACIGTIVITLLTVSYQSIKAALMNPVRSLRSE